MSESSEWLIQKANQTGSVDDDRTFRAIAAEIEADKARIVELKELCGEARHTIEVERGQLAAKDAEIVRLEAIYHDRLRRAGVQLCASRATVLDPHRVRLANGAEYSASHLLIATGGHPHVPAIQGAELGITSNEIFDLETQPKRMLVVGGGYVACEFAGIMNGLGTHVVQLYRGEQILRGFDQDLRDHVAAAMRARGIALEIQRLETQIEELTGNGRLLTGARTEDGRTVEGYLAIVGVGVVPNVELAEAAGANVDDGIVVDERFRTSLPDVYAIGDVARYPDPTTGRLRRIEHWSNADAQGAHLGRELAGSKAPYDVMPVFFTQLFGRKLQVLGDVEQAADCILRGSLAEGRLIGFHLTEDGKLVGAVIHGQAADVATELEELIREQPVVDDPTRLLDGNLRPAEAVVA